MVVSVDSQKIMKKSRSKYRGYQVFGKSNSSRYKSKRVSSEYGKSNSIKISRRPVSLFMVPFISALFIFSIYINLSDSFWQVKTPDFSIESFSLPDEAESDFDGAITMKASVGISLLTHTERVSETVSGVLSMTSYTIGEEDRYSIIAEKFQINLASLISLNEIDSNKTPVVGSKLKIPNISGVFYKVKKGDTLASISSQFDLNIDDISRVNQLYSSVIHIDEEIFLPGVTMDEDRLKRILGNRFIVPAAGTVKNTYGSSLDPTTGLRNYSYGIDILNDKGTAVYAAKEGVVTNTSYNAYFGRVILLNHSGSFQSMYGCLDSINVEPGQLVRQGDLLGYMGNSGFKSNDHLQFSIFKNKEDVDTLEYIF